MYSRTISDEIIRKFGRKKAILLTGPRQVGKTTLISEILKNQEHLFLNGDDPTIRRLLDSPNTEDIRSILGNHRFVFIDEAQRISNIGITLKIITDHFPEVQAIMSGSSSMELGNAFNEPLTGRKWSYELLPISWEEFENYHGYLAAEQQLENRMLYGFYPDVINNPGDEQTILNELVNSYLYRDILNLSGMRKPEVLEKLVQALALQIGSEVSYNELAQLIGIDKKTIANYIELLEHGYVLFRLGTYNTNQRDEIRQNKKIYFYDVGIRNAIIGNFFPMDLRSDKGALWENFLIAERIKQIKYHRTGTKYFFWRTKQQQEVDFVEMNNGKLDGYEIKWKLRGNPRVSRSFTGKYQAGEHLIHRNNFRNFVYLNKP